MALPYVVKKKIISYLATDPVVNSPFWAKTPDQILHLLTEQTPSSDQLIYIINLDMPHHKRWQIIARLSEQGYAFNEDQLTILIALAPSQITPVLLSMFRDQLTDNHLVDIIIRMNRNSVISVHSVPPHVKILYYAKKFRNRDVLPGPHSVDEAMWFLMTSPIGGQISGSFANCNCFIMGTFRTRDYVRYFRANMNHMHDGIRTIAIEIALLRAEPSEISGIVDFCAEINIELNATHLLIARIRRVLNLMIIDQITTNALMRRTTDVDIGTILSCDPDSVIDIVNMYFSTTHPSYSLYQHIAIIRSTGLNYLQQPLVTSNNVRLFLYSIHFFQPDALTAAQYDEMDSTLTFIAFVKCSRLYVLRPIPLEIRYNVMLSMTHDAIEGYFIQYQEIPRKEELDLWLDGLKPLRIFEPAFIRWRALLEPADYLFLALKCSSEEYVAFFNKLETEHRTDALVRLAVYRSNGNTDKFNLNETNISGDHLAMVLAINKQRSKFFENRLREEELFE